MPDRSPARMHNLVTEMEKLKSEHEDVLEKMKVENDALKVNKKLVDKVVEMLLESQKVKIKTLEDEISKKDAEIKKMKTTSILEGIQKFVLRRRRVTNVFKSYFDWFEWIKKNTEKEESIIFEHCIFVKFQNSWDGRRLIHIHFTEYSEFPMESNDEMVVPAINNGWSVPNIKACLLKDVSSEDGEGFMKGIELTCSGEVNELNGVGRYFSIQIDNDKEIQRMKSYQRLYKNQPAFTVLVFVRGSEKDLSDKDFQTQSKEKEEEK